LTVKGKKDSDGNPNKYPESVGIMNLSYAAVTTGGNTHGGIPQKCSRQWSNSLSSHRGPYQGVNVPQVTDCFKVSEICPKLTPSESEGWTPVGNCRQSIGISTRSMEKERLS
jgi:hypothetical protein